MNQKLEQEEPVQERWLQESVLRMQTLSIRRKEAVLEQLKRYLAAVEAPCSVHDGVIRRINMGASKVTELGNEFVYEACPRCVEDQAEINECAALHLAGVPIVMTRATFDSFHPHSASEEKFLESARKFAATQVGFLLMFGPVGKGKTHLAVAVMRAFRSRAFVKQGTLLRELRETYRNDNVSDPVSKYQRPRLLVLDEIGVSGGGKDELPMLHELLDYRHSNRLATVVTSNLTPDRLHEVLGDRLTDRLKQSSQGMLVFAGGSNRTEFKSEYADSFFDRVAKAARDMRDSRGQL